MVDITGKTLPVIPHPTEESRWETACAGSYAKGVNFIQLQPGGGHWAFYVWAKAGNGDLQAF